MIDTRCPARTLVTPRPGSTTSAENSCPSTCGSCEPLSRCGEAGMTIGPIAYSCRAVPQMPHQRGRMSTSPSPGPAGSATCSTRTSCSPWNTAAFMSPFQARIEEDLPSDLSRVQPVQLVGEGAEGMHALEQLVGQPAGREDVERGREVLAADVGEGGLDGLLLDDHRPDVDLRRLRGQPDLEDRSAGAREPECDVELAGGAAGLDHHVGARSPDRGHDLARGVGPRLDASRGPQPVRAFEPRAG